MFDLYVESCLLSLGFGTTTLQLTIVPTPASFLHVARALELKLENKRSIWGKKDKLK